MKKIFIIISVMILILLTACGKNKHTTSQIETIEPEFAVNLDEETNMYQFAYKKSVLNISKEKFDEYNLTNENIQKFFKKMEKVYVLLADFFLVHNLPDVFTYNSVTNEYMESVGVFVGAFSVGAENATYYVEGWLEGYLQDIDAGLPSIVAHEVGHLYTSCLAHNQNAFFVNSSKYVWDCEVFAVIATEYLLSRLDFNLINAVGGKYLPITETQKRVIKEDWYDEWVKNYQGFIHFKMSTINEKYGYDILHEVLAEMLNRDIKVHLDNAIDNNKRATFDLFFDVYSEKIGENLKDEYFTQEELEVIYKNIS